jgi:type 2 lantibiotic biosynthesis protein LanM
MLEAFVTMNHHLLLQPGWCRAATLKERAACSNPLQETSLDKELAARRIKRWRSQPPFEAGSYFAQRLALDGVSEDDLLNYLGEPDEALQCRLGGSPAWVGQLLAHSSRLRPSSPLPLPEIVRCQEAAGFLNLIEPVIQRALERVEDGARTLAALHSGVPFEPAAAARSLFASLPQQLLSMLGSTMVLELNVARLDGVLSGTTAAERFNSFLDRLRVPETAGALLCEYPVLARQLLLRINQWVDFSLEFLEHLASDRDDIREAFAEGKDLGMLLEADGGAGDGHRGGRSVLIAKFSSGVRAVYKPRSLSVDVHFQELLAWLNARCEGLPFRVLKVLDRGGHGWVEFVAAEECRSAQELSRFYERQGAYLALLYALEATDFHSENLIAAGEHPVLPDLEALFHPRIGGEDPRQAAALAGAAIANSVARVGLLPQLSWSGMDSEGIDLSGLGSLPGQLTPRPVPQWEQSGTDEMRQVRKRVEMAGGHNRPVLAGAEVDVLDYAEAIISGFGRLYHCLLKHRDELLSAQGPLARFARDEVRVILRATYTYGSLLQESFHPDVLRDALDRDRLFDRLWTAVEYMPHLAGVIPAERRDLESGDVPIFTTRPDSRHLRTSSRKVIPDFFEESGMALARRRLQQLSGQDCARQTWFIRASLAMLSKETESGWPRAPRPVGGKGDVDSARLVAAARDVGERLEQLALRGEDDVSWLGLTLSRQQRWSVAPLGLDLYDGLPGVALFLAHLAEFTGEARFNALARAALAALRRRLADAGSCSSAGIGGFSGLGGAIYALTHLSALWEEPSILDEAERVVDLIPPLISQDRQLDVIGGAAGCIGALARLHRCAPSIRTLAVAIQCGEHLIAEACPQEHGLGWLSGAAKDHPLTGISHGAAGIAWALLELFALSGQECFRSAALAGIEYERSLFSSQAGNWLDLREASASGSRQGVLRDGCMTAWCHGAPGIGLARLLSLPWMDDAISRCEIDVALETTLAHGFGGGHCLCHGDLGNLDVLLEACFGLGDAKWRYEVNRCAGMTVASIERNGWLCGNPLEVESPGLMTGLAGIGYGLLRLAEPTRVPSVLAFELPGLNSVGAPRRSSEVAVLRT